MPISQFFILNDHGDMLGNTIYRPDIPKNTVSTFFKHVSSQNSNNEPVFSINGLNYVYMNFNDLNFVFVTTTNDSPFTLLSILDRIISLLRDCLGDASEEAIRNNTPVVYEILDEIIDFGYISDLSSDKISSFIHNKAKASSNQGLLNMNLASRTKPSSATKVPLSDQIGQRLFVDIVENLSIVGDSSGNIINSELEGSIAIKNFNCTGNCVLKLNKRFAKLEAGSEISYTNAGGSELSVSDILFADYVDSDKYTSGIFDFVPSLGESVLMTYRTSQKVDVPLRVFAFTTIEKNRFTLNVKVVANAPVSNVKVDFPLPHGYQSCSFVLPNSTIHKSSPGNWTIDKLKEGEETAMQCNIAINNPQYVIIPELQVSFELPQKTFSDLKIVSLTATSNTQRWTKCISRVKNYSVRLDF
ncbi:hypothetical protein PCE1_000632 [Barthelona sp. PCE]